MLKIALLISFHTQPLPNQSGYAATTLFEGINCCQSHAWSVIKFGGWKDGGGGEGVEALGGTGVLQFFVNFLRPTGRFAWFCDHGLDSCCILPISLTDLLR